MTRYKYVNGERLAFTAEEETIRDAEEKAWDDDAPNRRMAKLRSERNSLLAETKDNLFCINLGSIEKFLTTLNSELNGP